jgi:spore germination protein D
MRYLAFLTGLVILVTAGCSPAQKPEESQGPDYQQMKQMVMDVLHTKEGEKALQEVMKDPEFKKNMVFTQKDLEMAVAKSFTDPKAKKELESLLKKPEVAKNLFKTVENEQKNLMKQLMKDPQYQQLMIDIMKDPQFEKNVLQLMKSQQYRKETMKVMEDALQAPSFKEKFMKLLQEAVKQAQSQKGGQGQGGEGGQGGQQGGGQGGQ